MTTEQTGGLRLTDMTAMHEALDCGQVTSAILVDRAIDRAQRANAQLNFMACPTFERARAQAAEPPTGPLAGIPTLIKDMIMERGVPATWGSVALRDFIAPDDSPYTKAIANAGLISVGRTAMPELGLNVVTESPLVGPTRNPWNPEYSPGGSSGGTGAAVAAGVVPVAHGSDGLGSIRHGAAPCGLVGLKPSRGRNAGEEAMRSIGDLNVNGCVSRTVRDTAMWFAATQSRDPAAAFAPAPFVAEPVDRPLRIRTYSTVMRTGQPPAPDVARVFAATIDLLGRFGHRVGDGALPFDGPAAMAMLSDVTEGTFARRLDLLSGQIGVPIAPEDLEYRSTTLVEAGKQIDDARYARGWEQAEQLVSAYLRQFDEIDIWMTPTFSTEIVRIGVFGPDTAWHEKRDHLLDFAGYCWIDNFAGTPSISLPMGFSDNAMPIGVQFATRPGGEALLLALAYQLEAEIEWWRHTPPIWVGDD